MTSHTRQLRPTTLAALSLGLLACAGSTAHAAQTISPGTIQPIAANIAPDPGRSVRVGGDLNAQVSTEDGMYSADPCSIDTPLPQGYPAPTPPGAIDLKTYPLVRMAEVQGSGDPDAGQSRAFWPLFNHIKGHDIAMTSPVEMNYHGMPGSERPSPDSWSMAFLYRTPELNATGVEGRVTVRDADPVTVVAIGLKGNYSMTLVQSGMEQIEQWLTANPQWEVAGDWRALYYNGPSLMWWNKWAEVQLPIKPSSPPPGVGPADSSGGAPK